MYKNEGKKISVHKIGCVILREKKFLTKEEYNVRINEKNLMMIDFSWNVIYFRYVSHLLSSFKGIKSFAVYICRAMEKFY